MLSRPGFRWARKKSPGQRSLELQVWTYLMAGVIRASSNQPKEVLWQKA